MVAIALTAGRHAAGVGKWGKAVGGECVNPKGCPPPSMAFPHGPEGMSIPGRPLLGGEGRGPMLLGHAAANYFAPAKYSEYTFFAHPLTLLRKASHAGTLCHPARSQTQIVRQRRRIAFAYLPDTRNDECGPQQI